MSLGRPQSGPGALADPGRRLGARLLDGLLLIPVLAAFVTLALVLVGPHVGSLFPTVGPDSGSTKLNVPGFVWIELAITGASLATGLVMVAYETIATARFGRTLGKAWLRIRPLRVDGGRVGWGRAFGRVAVIWLTGILNWIGLLDGLWCLWDDNRQCLHDKAADTVVVNDGIFEPNITAGQPPAPSTWPPSAAVDWHQPAPSPPPPSPYWSPYGYTGPVAPMRSHPNGFAIASLVSSLVGFFFLGLTGVLGVIFGFVARSQVRRSQGTQSGAGLALSGIIVGFAVIALWTGLFVLGAVTNNNSIGPSQSVPPTGGLGPSAGDLAIPGAAGYGSFDGPDGLPLALGRPWGNGCQPIVFSVNYNIPASAYDELEQVVTQARSAGLDVTTEDPQGYWQPGDLYPPGLTNAEVEFVAVFVNAGSAPTLSDGSPEHVEFGWDGHPSTDGANDVLTRVQATLYSENLPDAAAYRLADRQLVAFGEGVGSSTAVGSGIARGSSVDAFSEEDIAAMKTMSGCVSSP